jgi:hypothetical protein
MTGTNFSSWYNQNGGTWFMNSDYVQQSGAVGGVLAVSDGTSANRLNFGVNSVSPNYINHYCSVNNSAVFNANNTITASNRVKTAVSMSVASGFIAVDNGVSSSGTLSAVPPNQNRLDIGYISYGSAWANSHIQKVAFYPQPMTLTQLNALTGS